MRSHPRHLPIRRHRQEGHVARQIETLEARIVLSAGGASQDGWPAAPLAGPATWDGVTITPTQIIVGDETIPRFAAQPTVTSVASGNWTDPNIWSNRRVPAAGDRVSVAPNTTVNYGTTNSVRLNSVEVSGSLIFSTSVNTRMLVGNLTVLPSGTLQIGTEARPVAANVKAELIIADQKIDTNKDPEQYGTGLIALGTVSMNGTPTGNWTRLAAEPHKGDNSLLLSDKLAGWNPGDSLVLPDTRQVQAGWDLQFPAGQVSPQWEKVTISTMQGNRAYLTSPLQFDHKGAYNSSGGLELMPHVAHLDHNVVIRSERSTGTRGHVMFIGRADVDIQFARFQDLGRTSAFQSIDDTTFNASGSVTHVGTNQNYRYAVSFYDLLGPEKASTDFQFQFVGNTVDGARRFGVAVDDTSYGLLQDNVVYDAQGAGFATGEGSEIGNVFDHNITVRIVGTHLDGKAGAQGDDYGRGGSGFWFRRGGNTVINNVAADSTYAGFTIDGYYSRLVTLPNFPGAEADEAGQGTVTALNPSAPFENNEAYGMSTFGLWAAFIAGDNLLPNQPQTVFKDLRLWNTWIAGVLSYHTANTVYDGLLVLGDPAAQNRNDTGTVGMQFDTYEARDLVVRNSRIEGVRIGIIAPRNDSSTAGNPRPTIIQNTVLKNYINIRVSPAWDNRPGNGNALEVRDVKFSLNKQLPSGPAPAGSVDPPANIQMRLTSDAPNLTQPSVVTVYNYNQVPGDDFQVFYKEQAANYVMAKSDVSVLSGLKTSLIGSPMSGQTNTQNWSQFGIAVAGSVAPAPAMSRADINGLVGQIQPLSSLIPTVVLITPWNGATFDFTPPLRIRYNVNGLLPPGTSVYFTLDGSAPTTRFSDYVLSSVTKGQHVLKAFIGDSQGRQIAGTQAATSTFAIK